MKIRGGFVSNSSSSSFIVFGIERTMEEVLTQTFDNDVYIFGKYLSDGQDIFEVTPEIKKVLSKVGSDYYFDHTFVEVYKMFLDGYENNITKKEVVDMFKNVSDDTKIKLISGDKDYHRTTDVDSFVDRYFDNYSDILLKETKK